MAEPQLWSTAVIADPGAEMLRIGGDRQQRLGRGLEQQVIDHRLVLVGDVGDRGRQGEDEVEVGHGQEIGLALRQPVPCGGALTLRAVAVAAGVVGDLGVGAVLAARRHGRRAPRCGSSRSAAHHLELAEAHMAGVGVAPRGPVATEDVRDLQTAGGRMSRRALGRRLGLPVGSGVEPIERAHHRADRVGGDPRVERGGVELGVAQAGPGSRGCRCSAPAGGSRSCGAACAASPAC